MTQTPVLPSNFVAILLRYLDTQEMAAAALRRRLEAFAEQPQIENPNFVGLLDAVAEIDPAPALGLRIGLLAEPQDFGIAGYLMTACATLGQALTRYRRFQGLVLTGLDTRVSVANGAVAHLWQIQRMDHALACEFSVGVFVRLYQRLIGRTEPPLGVGLPFADNGKRSLYEAMLGCPVHFGSPGLKVDIPLALMGVTLSSSDPYLRKIFDQQAEATLNRARQSPSNDEAFLHALEQEVLAAIKDGDTNAARVAEKLDLSLRSFYRRLNQLGYSYRAILADLRRRLAKQYLADSQLAFSDIALLLGYSEQSAFIRAFRDWTGMTPGEYRRDLPG